MFIGETGGGKTTVARIIAKSLQCKHQDRFGNPCKKCRRSNGFDIVEINAGDITGIDPLRQAISGSNLEPMPGSRFRIYIIDEAHMLSKHAQTLLLKYTEDHSAKTTKYIICTTEAEKIIKTLRGRCYKKSVPSLTRKGLRILVKRVISYAGEDMDHLELAEALAENNITSPRAVVQAVEQYISGVPAEEAAQTDVSTNIDTYRICRNLVKGEWPAVAKILRDARPEDALPIRSAVCNYLRSILIDEQEYSKRAQIVADAIDRLSKIGWSESSIQIPTMVSILYTLCRWFNKYSR
jgi:DNA polymerase III delta prime subunit